MQTPLAVQLRQSPTPVAKGNATMLSAFSLLHNVVPRKRNRERCKPFFVSPTDRPAYVGDETVLAVLRKAEDGTRRPRRLRATARMYGNTARLEFAASIGDENFENRFALLGEGSGETTLERNVSLWMLRRPASTLRRNLSTS